MAIKLPAERRIICHDDESYTLPVAILDEQQLSLNDEEIIAAMAIYKPRTRFKESDFVILTQVPSWLRQKPTVPRCWKIRFIVTKWAFELIRVATRYGNDKITLHQAMAMLEQYKGFDEREYRNPMIYAHGYPHGEYPDSAAWLPEQLLRRTIYRESTMTWNHIIEEAGARYLGYDTEKIPTHFCLDLAPDNYSDGSNLGRPFVPEEPLVNTLHFVGLGEMLEVPYIIGERDRVKQLDEDHDIYDED